MPSSFATCVQSCGFNVKKYLLSAFVIISSSGSSVFDNLLFWVLTYDLTSSPRHVFTYPSLVDASSFYYSLSVSWIQCEGSNSQARFVIISSDVLPVYGNPSLRVTSVNLT